MSETPTARTRLIGPRSLDALEDMKYHRKTITFFTDETEERDAKAKKKGSLKVENVSERLSKLGANVVPNDISNAKKLDVVFVRQSAATSIRISMIPNLLLLLQQNNLKFIEYNGTSLVNSHELFPLSSKEIWTVFIGLDALSDDIISFTLELLLDLKETERSDKKWRFVFPPGSIENAISAKERNVPGARFAEDDINDLAISPGIKLTDLDVWNAPNTAVDVAHEALNENRYNLRNFIAIVRKPFLAKDGGGVLVLGIEEGLPQFVVEERKNKSKGKFSIGVNWSENELIGIRLARIASRPCRHLVIETKKRRLDTRAIVDLIKHIVSPLKIELITKIDENAVRVSFKDAKDASNIIQAMSGRKELEFATCSLNTFDGSVPSNILHISNVVDNQSQEIEKMINFNKGNILRQETNTTYSQLISDYFVEFPSISNAVSVAAELHDLEVGGLHIRVNFIQQDPKKTRINN